MAAHKATPNPHIPNGFDIDVDPDQLQNFPSQRRLTILLNHAHSGYELHRKPIPPGLKGEKFNNKTIQWINNFGLIEKGKTDYADLVPLYEVLLDPPESGIYVYYDGSSIRPLPVEPSASHPGKLSSGLKLGDPPIGWGG